MIRDIETGKSVNSEDGFVGANDIGVLKTSCVSYDVFDSGECKKVVHAEKSLVACPVRANTIIVSRMNTPDRVGACGYSPDDKVNLFLPDRLWQVNLKDGQDPYFTYVILSSRTNKKRLKDMASGTSGSMHNIPKESFVALQIKTPNSIVEQRQIGTFFRRLDNLITLHQRK